MNCDNRVNGNTKVFGIIGNPIEHTFSPILQNTIGTALGYNMIYAPFLVEKGNVKKAIDGGFALGIHGFNITVPHKKEVMDTLCAIDETAKIIGSVNTLKHTEKGYIGYNTDIIGLKKSLEEKEIEIKNKTLVVLGAGGAANSAVVLGAMENAKEIFIVNRTLETAQALADHVHTHFKTPVTPMDYDDIMEIKNPEILIQTTSLGMGETAGISPINNTSFFKKVKFAMDIIYTPWETEFLKDAAEYDCTVINGFDMLFYQGVAAFEIFNDIKIDNTFAKKIKEDLIEFYLDSKKKV